MKKNRLGDLNCNFFVKAIALFSAGAGRRVFKRSCQSNHFSSWHSICASGSGKIKKIEHDIMLIIMIKMLSDLLVLKMIGLI